jgi:hypothetical protein
MKIKYENGGWNVYKNDIPIAMGLTYVNAYRIKKYGRHLFLKIWG